MIRRYGYAGAAIGLLALSACGGAASSTSTTAAPQQLDAKRIFAQSKPAVVQVFVDVKATVSLPVPTMDENRLQNLENQVAVLVQSGQLGGDQNTILTYMLDQVAKNPLTYWVPTGDVVNIDTETGGQGTGVTIRDDGYVLTNAHVAAPNPDELKSALAEQAIPQFVDLGVKAVEQGAGDTGTVNVADPIKQSLTQYALKYLSIGKLDQSLFVVSGVQPPGLDVSQKGTIAEVVSHGDEFPGKDVAIIKVEKHSLPTVPLGDDTSLSTGDKLYAIGYPAAATFSGGIAKTSQTEPTLTAGVISATKTLTSGAPVLQTDAAISPGSSGGPAFDSQGRVIGLTTAGAVDGNGQHVAGENFVVPISVAKDFLARSNIKPAVSQTTQLYEQGLDNVDQQHYSEALKDFQQVNNLAPGMPYVQDQIASAQQAINQGKDKPIQAAASGGGMSISLIAGIAAAGAALIVVPVSLFVLMRRRRGERQGAATTAMNAVPQAPWAAVAPSTVPDQNSAAGYAPAPAVSDHTSAVPQYPLSSSLGYPQHGAPVYPPATSAWEPPGTPGYPTAQQPPAGYPQVGR